MTSSQYTAGWITPLTGMEAVADAEGVVHVCRGVYGVAGAAR